MVDVIQAIQTSIEIVGKLRSLAKKVEDAELKMLLADLSNELADAKLEVANLKEEIASLREKNRQQVEIIQNKASGKPKIVDDAYKFEDDDALYCTACFDVKTLRVKLKRLTGAFTTFGKWDCPACNAHYG